MPDTEGAQIPFGSGVLDSWTTNVGKTRNRVRQEHQRYGGGDLCTIGGKDGEFREPQHLWTEDDLEPVWRTNTETQDINAMMCEIEFLKKEVEVEQENRKFKAEFQQVRQERVRQEQERPVESKLVEPQRQVV